MAPNPADMLCPSIHGFISVCTDMYVIFSPQGVLKMVCGSNAQGRPFPVFVMMMMCVFPSILGV